MREEVRDVRHKKNIFIRYLPLSEYGKHTCESGVIRHDPPDWEGEREEGDAHHHGLRQEEGRQGRAGHPAPTRLVAKTIPRQD